MAIKFDTFKVGTGGAGTDNLDDVTSRGASTTNAITVGGVTVGTEYSLPTTDGSANQVISTNGSGTLSFTTLDFTGGLEYKGAFNATAGTPDLSSALKGDFYVIDTAGTIYGQTWAIGDHLLINADMGGSITNSKIDKIDNTDAVTSVNTQVGAVVLSANDLAADHVATHYTATNANIDGHLSGIDSALGTVASPTLDDVTTNGDTTTNAINVGTITTSGDIMPDADATRTIGDENTRFISIYSDMNGAIRFKAKNNQGSAITKGQAVYISGVSGTVPEVKLAQANSALTMPAFGLALANANDQAEVQVVTFGNLTDYNTTTYSLSANDTVYVSATTAGALTNSAPASESNLIQNIGRVVRADASAGIIKVGGAGRSNATPNLNNGKIFLGNASNQAVSTAISSIALSSFNDDLSYLSSGDNISLLNNNSGYITDITNESLNDLNDVSYTAGVGIDNYVLTYDHSTTSWGAEAAPTASAASETVAGVIEIATNAEATAATATDKALVPSNISSIALSSFNDDLSYLSSGDNISLLNNNSGYITNITNESLNDLSDVSYTAGVGIDNYVLTYDHSTTSWGAEAAPTASAASETVAGVIEIATNAEATAATATDKALVPSNISSIALSSFNDDLSYLSSGDNISLLTNNSGYISNINSESLNDLSDVSYTAGAGIDNYVLTYDHSTSSWGAEPSAGGGGGWTYSAITADPANAQANYHYSCTGTFTITLATTGMSAGDQIRIKNMGSGTITIDPQTVNIDGSTTDYVLDVRYSSITLVSDGTNYEVV